MRRDNFDVCVAEQMAPAWLWLSTTGQLKGPHPLFTFPLCIYGSLCSTCYNHDHILSPLSNEPPSALPTEQRRRRTAHPLFPPVPPSALLVAVAKLSTSFSQKWYPARRHAPSEIPSLLACCSAFYRLEMLLRRLLQPAEFLLTCVLV